VPKLGDLLPVIEDPPSFAEKGDLSQASRTLVVEGSARGPGERCTGGEMLIDCGQCAGQRTEACGECVVMHLLRDLPGPIEVEGDQAEALGILAECGLVPRLRLAPRVVNG
jgi:hypothetical protein